MNKHELLLVFFLFLTGFVSLVSMPREVYATAVVWTDKADYWPWEIVTIYGSGFNPNVYYDIPVIRPDGSIVRGDGSLTLGWDTVQADLSGKFTYFYQLDGIVGLYEVRVYNSPWSGSLDQAPLATTTFTEAPPKANLDQVRNGPATAPVSPGDWVNGNAGPSNAHYIEGYSIPYRCVMTDLPTGTPITLTLGYDIKHGGKHALDYLTYYDRINIPLHNDVFGHSAETIDPLIGVTVSTVTMTTFPIPAPSSAGSPVPGEPTTSFNSLSDWEKLMTLYGGTITGISYVSQGDLTASKSETQLSVIFTVDSSTAVLAWGGHIASRTDWGYEPGGDPRSAGGISGSPYHMRLIDWSLNTLGQQDRSLKSAAVYAPGSITVIKDAIPDDPQEFPFTSTTLGSFNLDDDGVGDNFIIFSGLAAGTYVVTEVVPSGWDLASIGISDPTGDSGSSGSTATIVLAAGETVIVTFTDTKWGKIIVDKITVPAADPQSFSFDASGPNSYSASFSLTDAQTPWDSGWLKPGSGYSVIETVPGGWDLTSVTVNGVASSNGASLTLNPGQILYVNFTDTKRGHIIVHKTTVPPGDPADFTFDPDYQVANFVLSDGEQYDSGAIMPGTYHVQELAVEGWDLTGLTVTDPSGGSSADLGTGTATIGLAAGETVHVYYTNTKRGKIIVDKVTDPSGSSQSFDFLVTGPSYSDSFSLTDAAAPHDSGWIKPSIYAVSETVPAGWVLTSAVCSDGSPINNIILDPGETVIVTFTNERAPPGKASLGNFVWEDLNGNGVQDPSEPGVSGVTASLYRSDGTFVGSTTTDGSGYYSFTDLDPGDYYLEFTLPSGYVFTLRDEGADDAVDSDVDPSTRQTMVINLQPGENDPSWDVGLIKTPVGGVWVPIDKTELLAPWISLASLITVAAVSIVYVKHKKKQHN